MAQRPASLLWRHLRPYRAPMALVLAGVLLQTGAGPLIPWLASRLVGVVAKGSQAVEGLLWLAAALTGAFAVRSVLQWAVFHGSHMVAWRVCRDLRLMVYRALQTLGAGFCATRKPGDLVARVAKDTEDVEPVVADAVHGSLVSLLVAAGVLAMLLALSPLLALVALLPLPVTAWAVLHLGRRIQPSFDAEGGRTGQLAVLTQDHVGGLREVQLFGQRALTRERFGAASDRPMRQQIEARRLMGPSTRSWRERRGYRAWRWSLWAVSSRCGKGFLSRRWWPSCFMWPRAGGSSG